MATIAVKPLMLKDTLFTVDEDDYQAHVSQVQFDPSSSIQTWKGMTPSSVHTDVTIATWTGTLAFIQDWETPDSLSRYLYEHEGEEVDVVFKPRSGSGPSWAVTIFVTPGAIGGTVDNWATASVQVGCKGRPALVPVSG